MPMAQFGTPRSPQQPEAGRGARVLVRVGRVLLMFVLSALGAYLGAIA